MPNVAADAALLNVCCLILSLQAIVASARIVPVPPVEVQGVGACIDGVYTDSQLVSSILLGRSFFTLHLEDAIRCMRHSVGWCSSGGGFHHTTAWASSMPRRRRVG